LNYQPRFHCRLAKHNECPWNRGHLNAVWPPLYGRVISEQEAVEILMNVKQFAEVGHLATRCTRIRMTTKITAVGLVAKAPNRESARLQVVDIAEQLAASAVKVAVIGIRSV